MIALLAIALMGQLPQPRLFLQPNSRGLAAGSGHVPTFVEAIEYQFGAYAQNPPAMPDFSGAYPYEHLLVLTRAKSDATTMETVKNDSGGIVAGSKTGGTGAVFRGTSTWGWPMQVDPTDSSAFKWTGVTETGNVFGGDHTVAVFGYPTDANANSVAYEPFDDGCPGTGGCGLWMRVEGNTLSCLWFEGTGTPSATVSAPKNSFTFLACVRDGVHHKAFANGAFGSTVDATNTIAAGTTTTIQSGRNVSSTGQSMRGQFAWGGIFSEAKTSAQLLKTMARLEAVTYPGFTGGVGGTQACIDADGGPIDCKIAINHTDQAGLLSMRAETETNVFAADNLDACSWVDRGTGTCNQNVTSGQFQFWRNTATVDRLNDSSAGFYCKESPGSLLMFDGGVTIQAGLMMGDAGTTVDKARLKLIIDGGTFLDGGTEVDCDVASLTATVVQHACSGDVISNGGGGVVGQVCVGNAAVDQGSVNVEWGKLLPVSYVTPVINQANNAGLGVKVILDTTSTPDGGVWPSVAAGGKYEIVGTPIQNGNSNWKTTDDVVTLLDTQTIVMAYGSGRAGDFTLSLTNIPSADTIHNTSFTVGQRYAWALRWVGSSTCTISILWDTCSSTWPNCVASTVRDSYVAAGCPAQPLAFAHVGNNYGLTQLSDIHLDGVRVYTYQ